MLNTFAQIHVVLWGLYDDRPSPPPTRFMLYVATDTQQLLGVDDDLNYFELTGGEGGATPAPQPILMNWTADGEARFVAWEAMTFSEAKEAGTGTLAYEKALAAAPTTFNGVTVPFSAAEDDVIRVTATGVDTIKTLTLVRSV